MPSPGALDPIRLIVDSPVITAIVGPQKQKFVVHRDLICVRSQMFAKAFNGSFQEAKTGIINMDDVPACLFRIFVAYIYHGRISYASDDPLSSGTDDFLDQLDEQIDEYGEDYLEDIDDQDPTTWPYTVLIELYLLGDLFDAPQFRNCIMNVLDDKIEDLGLPGKLCIKHAFQNSPASSPLREFLIHMVAYDGNFYESASEWVDMPVEFLAGVMVQLGRRLPRKTCRDCHKQALLTHGIYHKTPNDMCKDQDKAPRLQDRCFYHEHKGEKDKKKCRESHPY